MSDEPEQIEISMDEPEKTQKEPEVEVIKAEEARASKEIDPQEGMEALRAQLEREKAARIEAEKRANEHANSAAKAKNEVQDTNLHLVNNAIEQVKQNSEFLKSQYAAAMSAGDFMQAAEVQTSMSGNAAKLFQLEQGKEALENAPKVAAERVSPSDPVEALASQLSPKSADWVRRNPQCVTDPRMYQKMIAAHNIALADGHTADTDDYFDAIEGTLNINRKPSTDVYVDPTEQAAKPTQRRSSPPAAPVSRSGNGTSSRPNTIRLTAAEIEIASMTGLTPQEYARQKIRAAKQNN